MLRILVVEDNPELRETLAMLLEQEGREIHACASAEDALREVSAAAFDLVFTDIMLPHMSGLELAARLHALEPTTWVVLSSGGIVDLPADAATRPLRLLPKPFEIDDLDALLAEVEASRR